MNKILLVGYMGSGKSTVGRVLAEKLNVPFFDLDALIEQKEQKSVQEIFKTRGEIHFRKLEHQILHQFLRDNLNQQYVLSLGGGTPCYANNHEVLQYKDINSIYLKTSIKHLVDRLSTSSNKRPLVTDKSNEELMEFVAKHLFDRSYFYHQSKFTVTTDGKITSEVVNDILALLA